MNFAAQAGEPDRSLVFASFNQDNSSLSVGTKDGYQLFALSSVDVLDSIHTNVAEKDVCIVARLFSSSLIAVVSLKAPRKLKVCHFKKNTEICNYSYSNSILAVKLNRQESLYIHNIRDMKVIHTIRDTPANPLGLCDLTSSNDCSYLAYPGSAQSGTVQIFDTITLRAVTSIHAHDNKLAALAFNSTGNKIATASEKGTVIRVFSVPDASRLFEFRRGMKRCVTISSLSFSADSMFLAASSNTETVHIFKLEKKEESKPVDESHSWTGYVTSAFKSSASYLPTQRVSYVLVVSEDGTLHVFPFDVLEGGECQEKKVHKIDTMETWRMRRESNPDRPLTSQTRRPATSAEKRKSTSDSPASDSQSYHDVEAPGGSPSGSNLKLDDDSEFPPMSSD